MTKPRITDMLVGTNKTLAAIERTDRPRIALYSHDTEGLGHVRRNLLIAKALACKGKNPIILLLSGVHEAAAFAMPQGVDCLTLPSLRKDSKGKYFPRSLAVSMDQLIELRSQTISAALRSFQPDVLVVDKVPLGVFGELTSSLERILAGQTTKVILGLREILDDPLTVRREWLEGRFNEAIRKYYQRIWVYGDQRVYDCAHEYGFAPDIADRIRYTGYLNTFDTDNGIDEISEPSKDLGFSGGRSTLCVVGGGRDGLPLAEAFVRSQLPLGTFGTLVTGPLMPKDAVARLRQLSSDRSNLRILEFVTDPTRLMQQSDYVITMGGYNSTCEAVASGKPALIVPRIKPRTEQLIRAERFSQLGLVDMLHPNNLHPEKLTAWMLSAGDNHRNRPAAHTVIDLDGVRRLPTLMTEVLDTDLTEEPMYAAS